MARPYWRACLRACLIDDLRLAHRLWSIWFALAGVGFSAVSFALPPELDSRLITLLLFLGVIIARLLHQEGNGDG